MVNPFLVVCSWLRPYIRAQRAMHSDIWFAESAVNWTWRGWMSNRSKLFDKYEWEKYDLDRRKVRM